MKIFLSLTRDKDQECSERLRVNAEYPSILSKSKKNEPDKTIMQREVSLTHILPEQVKIIIVPY